ncbi:TraR/DksA family transcriptional regulator [Saccharospirillum salsuginis]|uniref:Molecular chaperone DnaK n=1 Tax=Saccharospirillum salsuginis TaxID=418750 RepID=A0A918KND6_9GAMM|nr:TraR/DksA C4-type zinc finger protein [Saccharospirillum salsuginis]GGX67694.1 molecular chaperone DnaK [Saccharospirillum salsuginis]
MTDELDIAHFEQVLNQQLDEWLQLEETRADSTGVVKLDQTSTGRLSRMDAMQQQALAKDRAARAKLEITRLKAALERCRDGHYGYCVDCDEVINPRRLELNPTALRCIRCESEAGN